MNVIRNAYSFCGEIHFEEREEDGRIAVTQIIKQKVLRMGGGWNSLWSLLNKGALF